MIRVNYPSRSEWPMLLQRPSFDPSSLHEVVSEVLQNVRSRGDDAVREYVLDNVVTAQFFDYFFPLLDMLLPVHRQEGKSYLTISIGCTGGHHRSVAIAEVTGMHLQEKWPSVRIIHRDIEKGLK